MIHPHQGSIVRLTWWEKEVSISGPMSNVLKLDIPMDSRHDDMTLVGLVDVDEAQFQAQSRSKLLFEATR